jgi:hypothetical protein
MKRNPFIVLVFLFPFFCNGQSIGDSVNLRSLLFEKFIDGIVRMKSGSVEQVPLNYNTDNQNIVFIKNGKYLVADDLETIDTVYVQQKKFVPFNSSFYQLVTKTSSMSLLISYTNKIRPFVATADHGGSSKQVLNQVSNTISDVYVNRIYKGNSSVEILKHYWLARNGKVYKIDSQKQFLSSFSSKTRKEIDNYIVANNIEIKNEADLIKLVDFCNKELE